MSRIESKNRIEGNQIPSGTTTAETVHSNFIKSTKTNNLTTCPVLTPKLVTKHIYIGIATTKGQTDQERQKLQ